ncbi:hypothetical protein HG530_003522 [Fusarium avenaceum]|nr:hypothetical protein HG530_003522 [Fusarium avenaceum]
MLSKVIAAGEFLAALVTLEGLLLSVERAVVALEVFLAAESAVAKITNEGLGRILSKRLLAPSAVGRSRKGSRGALRSGGGTRIAGISSLVGRLLCVTGLSSRSSNVHDGAGVVFAGVALLHTLIVVAILRSAARGRAGVGRELEGLVLVKGKILVTDKAAVAKGDN